MKVIQYILFIACIISLALFIQSAFWITSYPYGLDIFESYLFGNAKMMGEGMNVYGDINSSPYTVCNYPPIYPLLTGTIMEIGGVSIAVGRWASIISTLACCWLIGFITLRLTRNQLLSLILGLLFICIPPVFRWGQVMRVDALAVCLSLAGLAVYLTAGNDKKKLWCIPLFIAAFLTKQSMLAAPAAVIIHMLITNRKTGIRFGVITVASAAIVYLILNLVTDWGIFRHNFTYTANAFYMSRFIVGLKVYLIYTTPVILICLMHLVVGKSDFLKTPIALYFILASFTLITYGSEGSDSNYFIEPFAAALLLAGPAIYKWSWKPSQNGNSTSYAWVGAFLMVLLLTQFVMIRMLRSEEFIVMNVGVEDARQGELLETLIRNTPGDIVAEDPSFQILAGKPVLFTAYVMTTLAENGKWDQGGFVEDLRKGSFSLLILGFDVSNPAHTDRSDDEAYRAAGFNRFSDEMEQAIREAYEIDWNLPIHSRRNWYIYRPMNAAGNVQN